MGNGGFIKNNLLPNLSSISADTETADYEIENAVNGVPSEVYKATGSSAAIIIDLGSSQNFDAIALINHNINSGDTVIIKLSNDNFTTTDETIDISSRINPENMYYFFSSTKTYQYIKIEISIASGNVQIGEIYLGEKYVFSRNYKWGFNPIYNVIKNVNVVNGQYFEEAISSQRGWKLSFEGVNESEYDNLKELFEAGYKVFVPDTDEKDCYHGVIIGSFTPENKFGYLSFDLEFMENAK